VTDHESYRQRWSAAFNKPRFRIHFIATVVVLLSFLFLVPHFLEYIQLREGAVLNDPVLNLVVPQNLSWITFTLIYTSLVIGLISLLKAPEKLLTALQAYCILTIIRVITLFLTPLNNPPGIIILVDPFTGLIGYGGNIITKDLFFSGHISTMTLLYLTARNKKLKKILFISTIVIGCLLLIQHVHYTIDVIAAPVFTLVSFQCAKYLQREG
jgi:hypothetical protein